MRVSANYCHSGVDYPLLRHYNMYYTLGSGCSVEKFYAKIGAILSDVLEHFVGSRVGIRLSAVVCGDYVVDCGESALGVFYAEFQRTQHSESLGACHLVEKVSIHKQQG